MQASWSSLEALAASESRTITDLFSAEPDRVRRFTVRAAGLHADFSKQRLSQEALDKLLTLAESAHVADWIAKLFAGDAVNHTEDRAALHVALRAPQDQDYFAQGESVSADVHAVLTRMGAFVDKVRGGAWQGHTGQRITDIVNIGIGGSDLGPRMVAEALADLKPQDGHRNPRVHFVSNVDATEITRVLGQLMPANTLFIVTSKTFTTAETLANANTARQWLADTMGEVAVANHFVAVSTNADAVSAFGINTDNMFGFWDWVGGRYSLWSAVGLSLALRFGMDVFRALLSGAHAMDEHVRSAPLAENMAVWMALVGVWNHNCLQLPGQVVVPYAQALARFPAYLQQLEMESTGKGVTRDGQAVQRATVAPLWGDVGTNGQHAFFQMLHQGPVVLPVDFIAPLRVTHGVDHQHRMLLANCFAQSEALARGKSAGTVRDELIAKGLEGDALEAAIPHRVFSGNRPSTTLTMDTLNPETLGALIALYEHKVFVQAVLWDINPFDQWGVELGKHLASVIDSELAGGQLQPHDPSTAALIAQAREAFAAGADTAC